MTRPFTWLCLVMALGSGLFLYQTKHRAQLLDREITQVMKAADATRARSGVLKAEYDLLSDPQRLGELAAAHLSLRPPTPGQFSTWADLARRLPPIGLPAPDSTAEPDQLQQGTEIAAAGDLPLPPIPPGMAPAATQAPTMMAQLAPSTTSPQPAPASAPRPVAQPAAAAATVMASRQAPPAPPAPPPARPTPPAPTRMAALPSQGMTPVVSSVLATAPRPYGYGAPGYGAQAYAGAPGQYSGGQYAGGQRVGSALGMARGYQLPSPMGTANAAPVAGGNQ